MRMVQSGAISILNAVCATKFCVTRQALTREMERLRGRLSQRKSLQQLTLECQVFLTVILVIPPTPRNPEHCQEEEKNAVFLSGKTGLKIKIALGKEQ